MNAIALQWMLSFAELINTLSALKGTRFRDSRPRSCYSQTSPNLYSYFQCPDADRPWVADRINWLGRDWTERQCSSAASTTASLMSTALLAVRSVSVPSLASWRKCATASARAGSVSSSS